MVKFCRPEAREIWLQRQGTCMGACFSLISWYVVWLSLLCFLLVCDAGNGSTCHIGQLWNFLHLCLQIFHRSIKPYETGTGQQQQVVPQRSLCGMRGCVDHRQQSDVLLWKPSSLSFLLKRISTSFYSSGASLGTRLHFLCNGIPTPGAVKNRNSLTKAWTWVDIVKKVDDQYFMFLLFLAFSGRYEFIAT